MKGMMDFLEKAGLVKRDIPAGLSTNESTNAAATHQTSTPTPTPTDGSPVLTSPVEPGVGVNVTLNLDRIYSDHGVNPSLYPAERLMRLMDGLSAMDPATRQMAINAMDAADESWSIDDPLNDAAAKIQALAAHASSITGSLQQLELETQARLDAVTSRQEKVVGDIRKQMAELEGLVERELSRSAQEIATQEVNMKTAREQIARELAEVAQVSQRLQSLSGQVGVSKTNVQE